MNEMDYWKVMLELVLAMLFIALHVYGDATVGKDWPTVLIDEGETVQIPCIPLGKANTYYWKRGNDLNTSESIASFVYGYSSEVSNKFLVLANGTLMIYNISSEEEGKYFCRISSETNECHASVTVYVRVQNSQFTLTIGGCASNKLCILQLNPASKSNITCEADYASISTELRWFNDTDEISSGTITSTTAISGNLIKLSSTILIAYYNPMALICQAIDYRSKTGGMRFAYVHLEEDNGDTINSDVWWIITFAVLFTLALVFCIFLLFKVTLTKARHNHKATEEKKHDENVQLLEKNLQAKDDEMKMALDLQAKDQEIKTLTSTNEEQTRQCKRHTEQLENVQQKLKTSEHICSSQVMELTNKQAEYIETKLKLQKFVADLLIRKSKTQEKETWRFFCRFKANKPSSIIINSTGDKMSLQHQKPHVELNFIDVFSTSQNQNDLINSFDYLVENAVDGGKSCIFAFGGRNHSHWDIMYGSGNVANQAVLPRAIINIFKRKSESKQIDLKIQVKAKFMSATSNVHELICTFFDETKVDHNPERIRINELNEVNDGYKLVRKQKNQAEYKHGCFVQFYISIFHDETILTSGVITFVTFAELEEVKRCFKVISDSTKFDDRLQSFVFDKAAKSAIIVNFDEENEDETKEILNVTKEVQMKLNKQWSSLTKGC